MSSPSMNGITVHSRFDIKTVVIKLIVQKKAIYVDSMFYLLKEKQTHNELFRDIAPFDYVSIFLFILILNNYVEIITTTTIYMIAINVSHTLKQTSICIKIKSL